MNVSPSQSVMKNVVPTLAELVLFITRHRKNTKAFKDWQPIDIINGIVNALKLNCCVVDRDYYGVIQGILLGKPDKDTQILHINEILIAQGSEGVVKRMLLEFNQRFPGYSIQAKRKGKVVRYFKTARLVNLLNIISK